MAEQIMSDGSDPNSVRRVVSVQAPLEVAWHVFTKQMGSWWPLAWTRSVKPMPWMR